MERYIQAIQRYSTDLKGTSLKETPRKEKFLVLLKELFPTAVEEIRKYTDGAEHTVRLETSGHEIIKTGSIDAFFGDLIIEFERSMPAKKTEAERQLREYCAGLWSSETIKRQYICIATDGISWYTYFPSSSKLNDIRPEDVDLTEKETLIINDEPGIFESFFLFINRLFFREGRLKPTVENFTKDFGLQSYLFESVYRELSSAFNEIKTEPEVALSFSEWTRYLTYTYGSLSTNESLFCKHAYLSTLSRFIVWAALSQSHNQYDQTSLRLIISLIQGDYFERIGILNLAEKDFFHWIGHKKVLRRLEGSWLKVLNQLRTYDFADIDEDLLKGIYQELVDPSDRHDLGEYYTPDWLCEKIVNSLIEKTTVKIPSAIDITCGSGSFLRAAIRRIQDILQSKEGWKNIKLDTVLTAILANVHGIDIHPLAVMISKANYILAIKELLPYRRKPIRLPVYLADSLFMPQTDDITMFRRKNVIVHFLGEKYVLPHTFFSDSQAFDSSIALCFDAAANLAHDEKAESKEGFGNSLKKILTHIEEQEELGEISNQLFKLTNQLAVRIRERRDTIWSFILRNNLKPLFLHGAYDVVVGNPPWLSYRYIADPDYQGEIKKLSRETYGIAPDKQKLFTQMELATLFLVHAAHNYLKPGGGLGYVMPRSIFSADQHTKFREESFDAECDIREYWDLQNVFPLFNVPSCVVLARKGKPKKNRAYSALFISGKLPVRDLPLAQASKFLKEEQGKLYLSRMGERTALSRTEIRYEERPLPYKRRFSQGATIVPRNFYFVTAPNPNELTAFEFYARTDPEQAKEAKPPYKNIFLEGTVETDFLYRTALSKNLLPFYVGKLPYILLPVLKEDGQYKLKTASELRNLGYRKISDWFQRAEHEWDRNRGAKAKRQSLYERLNYHNELMKQNPDWDFLVLYNSAGTNLTSALLELEKTDKPFFAEHKTYWANVQTAEEGNYLVSFLNSNKVNETVKPFQSKGLMGERDIEKKVLEIPIPQYNRKNATHRRLAEIGANAATKVDDYAKTEGFQGSLAKMRARVRELLAQELKEIDEIVEKILG